MIAPLPELACMLLAVLLWPARPERPFLVAALGQALLAYALAALYVGLAGQECMPLPSPTIALKVAAGCAIWYAANGLLGLGARKRKGAEIVRF
jgi:hypothetical protein